MTVNERIIALRSHLNMTQSEFGHKAGLTQVGVWRIESGEVKPRKTTLEAICSRTGVSREWLIAGVGEMEFKGESLPEDNAWRDEAYSALKAHNEDLKQRVTWLETLVSKLAGSPNFRVPIDLAGARRAA